MHTIEIPGCGANEETELLVAFLLNAIGMQQKLLWQELNIGAAACAGDGRYLGYIWIC